jgi:CRP-like cAMP-binding protein
VSYSVRDILWLRWFAVAAALTNIPYFLVQGTVLWPPVLWASVFTVINLVQIARIYRERRPVVLSADEQALYELAFRQLRPRDFLTFALVGEWRDAEVGEPLLTVGEPAQRICIAISGEVEVRCRGASLGRVPPGHLVGTALVLTGGSSPVDARFVTAGRYISWSVQALRAFLDKRPELRVALQGLASRDLAAKLERALAVR